MKTIPLEQWADVLRAQITRLPTATNVVLEGLGEAMERNAKGMIGEYQPDWAPLAESTVEEKKALGYAPPDNPLLRDGDMRESIGHGIVGDMHAGAAVVVVGSPSEVALFQEMGTQDIPPRPFLARAVIEARPLVEKELGEMMVEVLGTVP